MKKILLLLSAALLGLVVLAGVSHIPRHRKPATFQEKTSHLITFLDKNGKDDTTCTATAIGPHALLTALHCDEDGSSKVLKVDLSMTKYHILTGITDNRDHLILLLDGPEFKNLVKEESLISPAPPRVGEKYFAYGHGNDYVFARQYSGVLDTERTAEEVSDVDLAEEARYFTIPAIGGDSGTAIFGSDGRIVGLISYSTSTGCEAFGLNFNPRAIQIAERFSVELLLTDSGR